MPRFLAVPSTSKHVSLGTSISRTVPAELLRKCKRSVVPCRGRNQCVQYRAAKRCHGPRGKNGVDAQMSVDPSELYIYLE